MSATQSSPTHPVGIGRAAYAGGRKDQELSMSGRCAASRDGLLFRRRPRASSWPPLVALLLLTGLTIGSAGYWLP
jgi:hypothetical protein